MLKKFLLLATISLGTFNLWAENNQKCIDLSNALQQKQIKRQDLQQKNITFNDELMRIKKDPSLDAIMKNEIKLLLEGFIESNTIAIKNLEEEMDQIKEIAAGLACHEI